MTDEWVEAVTQKLRDTNIQEKIDLADTIESAKDSGNLTKIVTVIDRTPQGNSGGLLGGINIFRIN
jgi:hypothetical protein